MSADIESVVLEKICTSKKFELQLDESTDISGHAQLLANVRFVDGDAIRENVLFCKTLPERVRRTGEEFFFGSCSHGCAHQRLCKQSEGKKPRCDCYALFFYTARPS